MTLSSALRCLLPALLACLLAGTVHGEPVVVILQGETGAAYAEVSEALRGELEQGGLAAADILSGSDVAALARVPARLHVAVGATALKAALDAEAKAPLLATLLPRLSYERILAQTGHGGRPVSAVYLDQPLGRQFELLRLALPDKHRVGVVLGPESAKAGGGLEAAAAEHGWRLLTSRASSAETIFPAMQKLVGDVDVLLAEPDATIYNGGTIQNILLTTYRAQIPLIGFSPAYVKAGALLALYSTPAQIGHQVAEIVRAVLAGRPLPAAQPPRDFVIAGNAHVARSLGVRLEDPARLAERLRQAERPQ